MRVLPIVNTGYNNRKKAAAAQPSFSSIIPKGFLGIGPFQAEQLLEGSQKSALECAPRIVAALSSLRNPGVYLGTGKQFSVVPYDKFVDALEKRPEDFGNITEIVFKRPADVKRDIWYKSTRKETRFGIQPSDVLSLLKTKVTKVTALVHDSVEELLLPADKEMRELALKRFKYATELADEMSPEFNEIRNPYGYFFDLVESMVARTKFSNDLTGFEARTSNLADFISR